MYLPEKMICIQCGIVLPKCRVEWMPTSKWGYERPFCSSCIQTCNTCHARYVQSMEYQHEECTDYHSLFPKDEDEDESEASMGDVTTFSDTE